MRTTDYSLKIGEGSRTSKAARGSRARLPKEKRIITRTVTGLVKCTSEDCAQWFLAGVGPASSRPEIRPAFDPKNGCRRGLFQPPHRAVPLLHARPTTSLINDVFNQRGTFPHSSMRCAQYGPLGSDQARRSAAPSRSTLARQHCRVSTTQIAPGRLNPTTTAVCRLIPLSGKGYISPNKKLITCGSSASHSGSDALPTTTTQSHVPDARLVRIASRRIFDTGWSVGFTTEWLGWLLSLLAYILVLLLIPMRVTASSFASLPARHRSSITSNNKTKRQVFS
jgi:hypothetical protein